MLLGQGLDRYKDSFNDWLSHSQKCVERSFGMLMQCWWVFWRPFWFAFDRWTLTLMAMAKLHKLCID